MQAVKMVITGPFAAGKTAFIGAVSEIDVVRTERKISSSAERVKETTTVAMDFGRITVDDDLVLYLFGTPGQRRFDFMWGVSYRARFGVRPGIGWDARTHRALASAIALNATSPTGVPLG